MPKILIPLDDGPASATTLAGARAIMGNMPWTVRLIYSGHDPEGTMRTHMDTVAADLKEEGHFVTVVMTAGASDAVSMLQRAIISPRMDIVVLTRQERGEGWLDAEVPVAMAHRSQFCPVLIMPAPPTPEAAASYQVGHLLVALDGSATAELGIDVSLTLAERLGARVTVMTVAEAGKAPVSQAESPAIATAADAEGYLDGVGQRYADRVQFARVARQTSQPISDALAQEARQRGAHLIVITSHGASGVRKSGLGQVAEALARTAPVPVLIARPIPTSQVRFGRGALLKSR